MNNTQKPYPFKKIAFANAFSPRTEALLHETKKLAAQLEVEELLIIHVGERNKGNEDRLNKALEDVGLNENKYRLVWEEGDPADTIYEVCLREKIELLIIGAMRREKFYTYYLGSVARKLSRKAPCSVLLLTDPKVEGQNFKRVVVNGLDHPKTRSTIYTSLYFAEKMHSKEVIVIEEVPPSDINIAVEDDLSLTKATRVRRSLRKRENERVENIIKHSTTTDGFNIKQKCIFGKPGYTIGHYAEAKKADLLVINSPDEKLGILDRFFPHDIEYILSDMPTNVLIVKARPENMEQ